MAHIRTGSIVADIRGKVGSEIYSRNRGGAYVKNLTSPVQPGTSEQLLRQSEMADAVATWQGFSEDERSEWNAAAKAVNERRSAFERKRDTGYSLFLRRKLNLLSIEVDNDPRSWNFSFMPLTGSFGFDALNSTTFTYQGGFSPSAGNVFVRTYASMPVSPGRMSPNGVTFKRFQSFGATDPVTGVNWRSAYEAAFANLAANVGNKVFIKWNLIYLYSPVYGFALDRLLGESIGGNNFFSAIIQS